MTFEVQTLNWYFLPMKDKPVDLGINPQVECAETLASHFYTDPAMLAREKKHIFLQTWQLVGTLSQSCGEVNGVKRTIADPESFLRSMSWASRL